MAALGALVGGSLGVAGKFAGVMIAVNGALILAPIGAVIGYLGFKAFNKKNKENKVVPSLMPPGLVEKKDEAQFHLLAPFGPAIGMIKMPDSFINKLLKVTDDVLSDKDRIDWGEHLVGQINEEPWIPNKVLEEAGLMEALRSCLHQYTTAMLQRQGLDHNHIDKVGVHMDHMWIVSQYENEYNPAHFHTFCDLSAVLYLKIPKFGILYVKLVISC